MASRKWPIGPIGQQDTAQLPMAEKAEQLVSQEFGSDGLKASEREAIRGVLTQFAAIQKAVLFGSRATGTYSPASDIDLVLYGDSLTLSDEFRIASRIEDLGLPLHVDLVQYHTITSKDLLGHIHRHGKLFYEAKGDREMVGWGSSGMASEWREVMLEDVADEIAVGHVGPMVTEYVPDGIPFLRSQNVEPLRINDSDLKFITPRFHERLKKSALSPGDVVIVRTGKPGSCAVIPGCFPVANCSDLVVVRCGEHLDPRFLAYYVNSAASHHVASQLVGAVQQHFNVGSARKILMRLPSLLEQRAIAHILGTLDDKIELNRRMNETLEAMARALFKSWFVDFDPVRAKAEGRAPGLPKPLADLFPDSFEDSELGEIPKGWSVGSVDDEFDLTMGQSPPGETYNEECKGLPFYQGRSDFGIRFPKRRVYCTAPTRLANAGDTLISVRAPVGDLNMATERCAIGRGVAAARHKMGSRSYSYQFMRSIEDVFERFEGEGTVFGSIGKKDFHAIPCVIPRRHLVVTFERSLAPIDDRIEVNERESRTLAALRDTLLPKLISGELRVKDVERLVAEVAP